MFYSIKHTPHFFKKKYERILSRLSTNFSWCIDKFSRGFFMDKKTCPFSSKNKKSLPFWKRLMRLCLRLFTHACLCSPAHACMHFCACDFARATLFRALRTGDKSVHQHTHHCGYKHDEYGVQSFALDFYVCHHHQHAEYDETNVVKVADAFPHR